MSDPDNNPFADFNVLAYNSSKAALNAITLLYANELRGTGILVNSVSPGYVATGFNYHSGPLSVEQGATVPMRAATLPADGPTVLLPGRQGFLVRKERSGALKFGHKARGWILG